MSQIIHDPTEWIKCTDCGEEVPINEGRHLCSDEDELTYSTDVTIRVYHDGTVDDAYLLDWASSVSEDLADDLRGMYDCPISVPEDQLCVATN